MTNTLEAAIEFDRNLTLGQAVEIRWTNCGRMYRSQAHISKINAKTVRARLFLPIFEDPNDYQSGVRYPGGQEIIVPRILTTGQSDNNGVFPVRA